MALIKTLKDKLGNIIYPRTKEKAIYDDDDIRLDNKLLAMKNPVTSSADGTWTNDLNTFMDLNKLVGVNLENNSTLNAPPISYGKAINIGFLPSVFNQYVYANGGVTYVRKYVDWEVPQWGAWRKLITEADIIQTDTVNNTTQAPSSAVTYALGQEIDGFTNRGFGVAASNISHQDLNNIRTNGIYNGDYLTNAPNGTVAWLYVEVIRHIFSDEYVIQKVSMLGHHEHTQYIRKRVNSVWGNWYAIQYAENILGFADGETILSFANACSTSVSKIIASPNYPSDLPSDLSTQSSREGMIEVLVGGGGRKIVRLTTYNLSPKAVYYRDIFGSAYLASWYKIATTVVS